MNTFTSLAEMPSRPVVLAAGAFDGLHLGHVEVIETARRLAGEKNADLGVLRFYPHPARVLNPDAAPPLLGSEDTLAERLEQLGVAFQIRLPFSTAFSQVEPETFLEDLRSGLPGLKGMVVGSNWRFGHRGRGDLALLQTWGQQHQVEIRQTDDIRHGEDMISSTRIRSAVRSGDMETARRLLGRPFCLSGVVQQGKQLGRELGFPTANFLPREECLPPEGVYAMNVRIGKQEPRLGAGYITHNPDLVEVHLFDFEGDLYRKDLRVDLLDFRRAATPISDLEILRRRIQEDVEGIRREYQA
jgi:riboflavin kinase/FMN adenylyltransferase